jgi:putative ABC transport system substrate-binding protein
MRRVLAAVIFCLCTVTFPGLARAQQPRVATIGVLVASTPDPAAYLNGFRDGLKAVGYSEGQNFRLEIRTPEDKPDELLAAARELVALDVEVIVGFQTPALEAAVQATHRIPIVAQSGDPVGLGLIASLAHPGGNVTGVSSAAAETAAKDLQVLHDLLPVLRHVGVLCNAIDPFHTPFLEAIEGAAKGLGIAVTPACVQGSPGIEGGLAELRARHIDALLVQPSLGAEQPAKLALDARLPAASPIPLFARQRGLLSYSADQPAMLRRVAVVVDKILKGAKPADLPVEQATIFDLLINRTTAKALGITIPQSLLARADELID